MVYYLSSKTLAPYYVDVQHLDGDPQQIEVVDPTQDDGMYFERGFYGLKSGRRIKADWVPTRLEWRAPTKYLPDFETIYGLLSISKAFKTVVEQVEPDVHQFLSVEYVDKGGKHIADRWFMIVCNRIDSTDHEATEATGMSLSGRRFWRSARELANAKSADWDDVPRTEKLVFSEAKVRGRHLWFDKFSYDGPYLSETIAEALTDKALKGLKLTKGGSV